ncbi:hypothetical protein [Nocardia suismassiliense]|uniref:hypothetical protein n=1 Tax=Nocardia suismassiliense TaxID=2077092 RepID=UPI00131EDC79|nr:hypothetical protein [Nocardia suismassiliense]
MNHTSCGGVGKTSEVRVDKAEGSVVNMTPGQPYDFEVDFVPKDSSLTSVTVEAEYMGSPITLLDSAAVGSSTAGALTTARFTIIPNDVLSGETVPIRIELRSATPQRLQACASLKAHIN